MQIEQLCTGRAERFLYDAKRLSLAIVGLQAFADQHYLSAERALAEAELSKVEDDDDQDDDSKVLAKGRNAGDNERCDNSLPRSLCSGVLAFYLAVLNQRLGHYATAEKEYSFAATKLNRPAPYVDLAELYALENMGPQALDALKKAEWADPDSMLAVATRAQYEQQFGDDNQSKVELDRAVTLSRSQPVSEYDSVALCRATYYRDTEAGLRCLSGAGPGKIVDTQIKHARWLIATQRRPQIEEGIVELRRALARAPRNIKANYMLARALSDIGLQGDQEVRQHYLIALDARAYTDDDFTDQGNAAAALLDIARARALNREALL